MSDEWKLEGTTILVADDNPNNLQVMESMLREFGCQVRVALDGEAALKSATLNPPDLILLDIHMPKMDGYQACRALKENEITEAVPVIFVSAMNDEFNRLEGFACGAVDYIMKPIHFEELCARISVHMRLMHQQEYLRRRTNDLAELNDSMTGREVRVMELKREVNALARELGRDAPYGEVDD